MGFILRIHKEKLLFVRKTHIYFGQILKVEYYTNERIFFTHESND
mgnify:CR=1 FL=1